MDDVNNYYGTIGFGYKTGEEFCIKSSSSTLIENFKIKTLFISAIDDPIVPNTYDSIKKFDKNENVFVIATYGGGHCAHFESIFNTK